MADRPLVALAVAVVLATSAVPLGAGVASAESQVVVQSVAVDPSTPRVGEDVTVTATLRNFESSSDAARINQVSLRAGTRTLATAKDLGTLGPGGTGNLPLTTDFETPGRKALTLHVYGQGIDGGVFNVKYPVSVSVNERDSDVQLSLETPSEPSTEGRVNVTVANGAPTNITNLQLTLSGPNATVDDASRVNASLGSGHERRVAFDVSFARPGPQPLTAALSYRDDDGDRRTVAESRTFDVEPPDVDADLDAEVVRENGSARIDAERAELAGGRWVLHDAQVARPGERTHRVARREITTSLTPREIYNSFAPPETVSFWALPEFIRTLENAGFTAEPQKLHYHRLLSMPVLLAAMTLLAAAFSLRSHRHGGAPVLIVAGVLTGFALHVLSNLVFAIGLSSPLPVALAAWAPAAMTLLLGVAALLHQEDG